MLSFVLLEIHPLINPELGLSVWTIITFVILLVLLRVFAWKPIITSIKRRENFINNSLEKATLAKKEFIELETKKDELIKEAEIKSLAIIKEAEIIKHKTIQQAEIDAKKHAEEIKKQASIELNAQKKQVMLSIEKDISKLAIDIAEKLINHELSNETKQADIINKLAKNIQL